MNIEINVRLHLQYIMTLNELTKHTNLHIIIKLRQKNNNFIYLHKEYNNFT